MRNGFFVLQAVTTCEPPHCQLRKCKSQGFFIPDNHLPAQAPTGRNWQENSEPDDPTACQMHSQSGVRGSASIYRMSSARDSKPRSHPSASRDRMPQLQEFGEWIVHFLIDDDTQSDRNLCEASVQPQNDKGERPAAHDSKQPIRPRTNRHAKCRFARPSWAIEIVQHWCACHVLGSASC
jgi:hypothetical protein